MRWFAADHTTEKRVYHHLQVWCTVGYDMVLAYNWYGSWYAPP